MFHIHRERVFSGFEPEFAAALDNLLSGEPYTVERCWDSGAARCHVLLLGSGRRVFLKQPFSLDLLAGEIEIVRRVTASDSPVAHLFPVLLGVTGARDGLLMEFVGDPSLRESLAQSAAGRQASTRLVEGLRAYHRAESQPMADFHPGNVLLGARGLTFLDPSTPDRHRRTPEEQPMATDLGYWFASAAASFLSDCRRQKALAWRLFKFNRSVLSEALRKPGAMTSREEIMAVASREIGWVRSSRGRRTRAAYVPALLYLWALPRFVRAPAQRAPTSAPALPGAFRDEPQDAVPGPLP